MGTFIFGDTDEIVCQHDDLGETRFYPKAGEAYTMDKGGFRANDDAAQVTASGQNMNQINRVKWSIEGAIAVDVVNDTELNILEKLAKSAKDATWTFSLMGGVIYKAKGRPVGDQQYDTSAGTMTLKVSGGGQMEKI